MKLSSCQVVEGDMVADLQGGGSTQPNIIIKTIFKPNILKSNIFKSNILILKSNIKPNIFKPNILKSNTKAKMIINIISRWIYTTKPLSSGTGTVGGWR